MSADAATIKARSNRSKEYKEECRQLLERVVALQLKVYKAPDLYTQEVLKVIDHFKQEYEIVKENPGVNNQKFVIVSQFLSKVAIFYKTDMVFYIEDLMELINSFQNTLHPNLRLKIVLHLLRARGKGLIEPYRMIVFLMKLFNTQDKNLRRIVYRFIIKDIRNFNKKKKNDQLNKQIQNFIVDLIKKSTQNIAKRALQILIELYRKNIWKDTKVVNIIAQGCFSLNYKMKLLACCFLIETTETKKEMESSDEEEEEFIKKKGKNKSVKPTKAREHRLEKEKKQAARKQRRRQRRLNANGGFFPLDLIYNPQDFCERLFGSLKKNESEKFTVKLAMMHVISRMINRHKLVLLPFYSYLQKYLFPNGKEISKLLCYLAEAVHENIAKIDLDSTMKHLIEQFVNDRCSEQTITMGLRTIYEIVQKHKTVLDKFNVNYLAHYIKYKNRNVSQAARALLNFYRETLPQLLERKYRGKNWKEEEEVDEVPETTAMKVSYGIEGAELLQEEEENRMQKKFDVPIFCDRVLTDEDLRRIRALRRKKEAEEEAKRMEANNSKFYGSDEESDACEEEEDAIDEEVLDDEEGEWDDVSEISGEDDVDDDDIDEGEMDEEEDEEGEDEDEVEVEVEGIEDEDENEDEDEEAEEVEEDEEAEEVEEEKKKKAAVSRKAKAQNKLRRQSLSELEDSVQQYYSESEKEDDENPHGFVHEEKITQYRKTKSEQKQAKLEQEKEKWYTGPNKKKSEFASKSNKEKEKMKPLAMVRAKKVQEKSKEKHIKSKIKDLKNQLGHVRSGKQAKKLKKIKFG